MYVTEKQAELGVAWGQILASAGPTVIKGLKDAAGSIMGAKRERERAKARQAEAEAALIAQKQKTQQVLIIGGVAVAGVLALVLATRGNRGRK